MEPSAWAKRANTRARASAVMPMPVSATAKATWRRSPWVRVRTDNRTQPRSVNLTALLHRLVRIWVRRTLSARTGLEEAASRSRSKRRPLAAEGAANSLATWRARLAGATGSLCRSIWPASILARSSTSDSRVCRLAPEVRITSTISFCADSSGVRPSTLAMPIMPFSGVRSSWLILARNSLLARSASSAAFSASFSAVSAWCCTLTSTAAARVAGRPWKVRGCM